MKKTSIRRAYHIVSRDIWEKYHDEEIPDGWQVHHKDGNWDNLHPENLEAVPKKEHWVRHGEMKEQEAIHFLIVSKKKIVTETLYDELYNILRKEKLAKYAKIEKDIEDGL